MCTQGKPIEANRQKQVNTYKESKQQNKYAAVAAVNIVVKHLELSQSSLEILVPGSPSKALFFLVKLHLSYDIDIHV